MEEQNGPKYSPQGSLPVYLLLDSLFAPGDSSTSHLRGGSAKGSAPGLSRDLKRQLHVIDELFRHPEVVDFSALRVGGLKSGGCCWLLA